MPLYEGFPLHHASIKLNYGGEDISKELLEMIKDKINLSISRYHARDALSMYRLYISFGFIFFDYLDISK